MSRFIVRMAIVAAAALAVALSGCVLVPDKSTSSATAKATGTVNVQATWGEWEGDPLPHLILTLSHRSGGPVDVGAFATPIEITGPRGVVPVSWGSATGAREIAGTDSVTLALHPRLGADGNFTLTLDHAMGTPARGPSGTYFACVRDDCARAVLS